MLTDAHKTKRLASALKFLNRYSEEGNEFLNKIVTGDETWVCLVTPQSKQQSMEWKHSRSPTKHIQGILLVEFLPRGETINAVRYSETL
ncbi:hypothetical protein AVEN_234695-1 [Araneus ventricosus]|uniref:Uncharacterized protein n=1 Tax=Araneus ventricosus TaxID=182803 RepID=A0A4Y2KB11_ARAVE|nr:hypothetical protein AVEN_234695-1 [Araneus ventricosus]